MPVPKRFYYTETRSGKRYKSDPAGTSDIVDLDRFRAGLPAWEDHQPVRVTLPKKLILADWMIHAWSYAKTEAVIAVLSQLIRKGFEIYLWQFDGNGFDQVVPLNELHLTDLYDKDITHKVTLEEDDVILETASKQQKIPRDNLALLDDYGIAQLLQDTDQDIPRELPVLTTKYLGFKYHYNSNAEKKRQEKILSFLKNRSPGYHHFIYEPATDPFNSMHCISFLFPDLPHKNRYQTVYDFNVINNSTNPLTSEESSTITCVYLTRNNYADIFTLCHHAKEIHACSGISLNLAALFEYVPPTLKYLSFDNAQITFPVSKTLPMHAQLEILVIENGWSRIPTEAIEAIILAAPNLRKINLNSDSTIVFQAPLPIMAKLEEITLKSSGGEEAKRILLAAAPNLRKLSIVINEPQTLNVITSKDALEILELFGVKLFSHDVKILFEQFPNLKRLKISIENNTSFSNLPALFDLAELSVYSSFLNQADLEKLLVAMPNLKQLDLSGCKNIVEEELPEYIRNILVKHPNYKRGESLHPEDAEHDEGVEGTEGSNPVDPTWNADDLKNEIPPSLQNKSFQYKGDKTKSQRMIIEKLCQYLTLTQQHTASIQKIQDGICLALSRFFIAKQKDQSWDYFLNLISNWDGKLETLTDNLRAALNNFFFTKLYYETALDSEKKHYLGDNAECFFLENKKPHIIANPVHAIAIYPASRATWLVYDPNYVAGPKEVSAFELSTVIKKSMGNLLSVQSEIQLIPSKINNPELFIAEGGLLALITSCHVDQLLAQLPVEDIYSRKALDGILLRFSGSGVPAWVRGLENPETQQFTKYLLQLFIQHNRTDYKEKLKKSAELLSPYHLHEVMTNLIQLFPASEQRNELVETVRTIAPANHYENRLATWHKKTSAHDSPLTFCQEISNGLVKKRLIEFSSTEQLQGMRFALEAYCHKQKTHHPIFYIHSPDDLVCAAAYIERQGDRGIIKKGPGGALYDFLNGKYERDAIPILVVNYEKFHADDIVRLNALLDKKRSVDNIPLSENTLVVGLINTNNPKCYQGSDFYSRFDVTEKCPISTQTLQNKIPVIAMHEKIKDEETFPIHLFHGQDWKNQLLGNWVFQNGDLIFKEGILSQALAQTKPIEIHNGLWKDEEFQRFWREVARDHSDLHFVISEGYDWKKLSVNCKPLSSKKPNAELLNPYVLSQFFHQLYFDSKNNLNYLPGLIELSTGKTLSVLVTRTISDDDWARIISQCQLHNVTLHIAQSVDVTLPTTPQELNAPIIVEKCKASVFSSNDVDLASIELTKQYKNTVVIDISDLHPTDLIVRMSGNFDNDTLKYFFEEKKRALLLELEKGNHVILKGHFSAELVDALLPILFTNVASEITIVCDDRTAFNAVIADDKYTVTPALKLSSLGKISDELRDHLAPFAETESFAQLRARRDFLLTNPTALSSDAAWQGLRHLLPNSSTADDLLTADQYNKKRLKQIHDVLLQAPYVFIAGLTGVGKSTFIEKHLCTDNDTLLIGEKNIKKWTELKESDGYHYLFLDEATLNQRNWNEFEGLFSDPRGIVVDGIFHSLTEKHKVIFAGNPVSYGDERKLSPFFEKHGNALVFDPMPLNVIDELILKPVLDLFKTDVAALKNYLLTAYRDLCLLSKKEILISPRELQMIALLILSAHLRNQELPLMLIAERVADDIINPLLPNNKRKKQDQVFQHPCSIQSTDEFVVTPSRQAVIHRLDDLLALRELRRQSSETNDALRYGGLGGVILEGEPGVGKSELVTRLLAVHKFEEQNCEDLETPATTESPFYRMPVNFSLAQKEALLLKAFREGAVVVIDEINSSPMMEALLNDLLMGKAPGNIRPEKPGFFVIGTQNPTTMAGRRAPSTALSRRLLQLDVLPYAREELMAILVAKSIENEQASALINAYEKQVAHAKVHRLSPAPTFRDLDRLANEVRDITNTASIQSHRLFSAVASNKPDENGSKKTVQTRFF